MKKLANAAYAHAIPIDFDKLVEKGILKKSGSSYYVEDISRLPDNVSQRITSIEKTKKGTKVKFSKETKSMQKISEKFKQYRD